MLLLTHQPLRPKEPPHQGRLSLSAFAELTRALLSAGGARPTLDLSGGQVKLHLTTRSRRPGRLSVRSEDSLEVLNFSPLNPVAEEFQNVLERATALAQAPGETSLPGP